MEPTRATETRMEWRRAWKALRVLIADPERTDQVFEITQALSGSGFEKAFQRFYATEEGQRLLAERPSLLEALSNREALRALPPGSFGRAYVDFMEGGGLTADGLVEADAMAAQKRPDDEPEDPDREFFGTRMRDAHDLWHVLTGYGMDEAGEAANLAFTFAQLPNLGIGLIVVAAAAIGPKDLRLSWQRYLFSAWRRGRKTSMLPAARYEELLPLPLEEVRRVLRVPPASEAHPEGILVANRDEEGNASLLGGNVSVRPGAVG